VGGRIPLTRVNRIFTINLGEEAFSGRLAIENNIPERWLIWAGALRRLQKMGKSA
jgi:hypothetical protein